MYEEASNLPLRPASLAYIFCIINGIFTPAKKNLEEFADRKRSACRTRDKRVGELHADDDRYGESAVRQYVSGTHVPFSRDIYAIVSLASNVIGFSTLLYSKSLNLFLPQTFP